MMENTKRDDFYQLLRGRISAWLEQQGDDYKHAQLLLLAPDLFHLLCRLSVDERVDSSHKAKLAAAIVYFVSPIDLIPEAITGAVGYLDDVAVAAYALNSIINAGHGEIAKEHWAGQGDLLSHVQLIIAKADETLGSGLWRKIRARLDASGTSR